MGFEVFSRQTPRVGTSLTLNINPKGRIGISQKAARFLGLESGSLVLVLWDKEKKRLAIQKINDDDVRAYKVSYSNNSAGIHAVNFLKHIGYTASETRTLIGEWNEADSLFEVAIPLDLLSTNQKLDSVDNSKKKGNQKQRREVETKTVRPSGKT